MVNNADPTWQTFYGLLSTWIDQSNEDGSFPVHNVLEETCRDMAAVGYDLERTSALASEVYGSIMADRVGKWRQELETDAAALHERQKKAHRRIAEAAVVFIDPEELKR